jgi:hypothetical protein
MPDGFWPAKGWKTCPADGLVENPSAFPLKKRTAIAKTWKNSPRKNHFTGPRPRLRAIDIQTMAPMIGKNSSKFTPLFFAN